MRVTQVSAESAADLGWGWGFAPNLEGFFQKPHQTLGTLHWCQGTVADRFLLFHDRPILVPSLFHYASMFHHRSIVTLLFVNTQISDATFNAFLAISSAFISVSINTFAAARA